jgi:carboxypeptidase family protein/TonB-dependent receptor-like protein
MVLRPRRFARGGSLRFAGEISSWASFACVAVLPPLQPQSPARVVQGIVVDSAGSVVPYANVTITRSGRRLTAGQDGRFVLSLDSTVKHTIEIRRIGFQPLTLNLDPLPDSLLRAVLAPAVRTLETQTVVAERTRVLALHGFYERMSDVEKGINNGFFITPEELASRPGGRLTDFLRGHPGVRVTLVSEDPFGRGRKGWQPQRLDGCRMEIYVDGIRFYNLMGRTGGGFIEDAIQPSTIAAVEVYPRSVTAPPKYQSLNGMCGVILIWTK